MELRNLQVKRLKIALWMSFSRRLTFVDNDPQVLPIFPKNFHTWSSQARTYYY
ncbi:hypothetical protein GcM3_021008 [Golovinomyces cichoracearum]|uniref:Uncharacterized protein n=1 Tax=Golovinomyces cichoracearum TaxID=62708 RepID=A0A420J7L4_9PEZI|nr:hypothetical protein GcM3_021008 [Golovinomyces cichoracearum]